jgi:hypothetical protein
MIGPTLWAVESKGMRLVERLRKCGGFDFALTHNNNILVYSSNCLDKIISAHYQQVVRAKRRSLRPTHPECHGSRLFLSPALPSTVMYPSPLSAVMNTIAVSAWAAAEAPAAVPSVIELTIFVPSFAACVLIASAGAMK